jgi:4-amino-4-deoxy-L-arabinose transferase-like glycosyltransferase
MIGFSHAAATDMPFSAMLTIAMVCAPVVLGLARNENTPVLPRTPWLALILFGFFLGLAVLAKGPAAIILCGGAIFFWALFTKRWRDAFRLLHPAAIASFCLTALPWYILCARRNPDFFRIFIIEHNFKRYLTPEFQHLQPFWFYIPILALGLLPWTASSILFLRDGVRSWEKIDWLNSKDLLFACWATLPVVFFSVSKSKLPGYILPVIPPLQILAAQCVSLRVRKARWIVVLSGVTLMTLSLLSFLQSERIDFHWTALVLAAGGFATVFPGNLWRLSQALAICVLTVVVAITVVFTGYAGPALDHSVSPRFALQAARVIWSNYSPEHASTYKLQRSFQYSVSFYFHRELPEWSPSGVKPAWIFTSRKESSELEGLGLKCVSPGFHSAVILCEDTGSTSSLPDSRQPR